MTHPAIEALAGTTRLAGARHHRLHLELRRVRKILERRVLWLRLQWKHDPLQSYGAMVVSDARADSLLAEADRGAELRFYRDDPDASAITREIGALDEERAADTTSPLSEIRRTFGLTDFDVDAVVLCAAPELDPSLERVYAYVQDDAARRSATAHLAVALFAGEQDPLDLLNRFDSSAPLMRFHLLAADTTVPSPAAVRPLHVEDRVLRHLLGLNRLDARVAGLLAPLTAGPLPSCQSAILERLARTIQTGSLARPVVNLVCGAGAGAGSFAAWLCQRLSVDARRLDASNLPARGPAREDMLQLIERDAMLSQFVVYVECDSPGPDWDWIDRIGAFLIVRSVARLRLRQGGLSLALPAPDPVSAGEMWTETLIDGDVAVPDRVEQVAQQFNFAPEAVPQVVADAIAHSEFEGGGPLSTAHLWHACRSYADRQLDGLAQRVELRYEWNDLVLPEDAMAQLREIGSQVRQRHRVHVQWGFERTLQRGRGVAALFAGPSGTGKTMAAEVLARALDLDLYRIDLATVVSKYIGETEKNLKRLFDAADQGGAILFFDEADALFGKRTEVKDSHDRYANIEVNYLLQRMEDYRGLAVLATNRKTALDRAFLRRLRFLVDFPFPDFESRRRIWERSFPPEAPLCGISFDSLARMELAGGNIRNIALNAAFLAADDGEIRPEHVGRAARREYAKIDQVFQEGLV
jgi:hypothetical protein